VCAVREEGMMLAHHPSVKQGIAAILYGFGFQLKLTTRKKQWLLA